MSVCATFVPPTKVAVAPMPATPVLNGGCLFRPCTLERDGDVISGILDDAKTTDIVASVWLPSELKARQFERAEYHLTVGKPFGVELPDGSEATQTRNLGVLGSHKQLELVAEPKAGIEVFEVFLFADDQSKFGNAPAGVRVYTDPEQGRQGEQGGERTLFYCQAKLDLETISVRDATLALAERDVGMSPACDYRIDRFLCDRLARLASWATPSGGDRASLRPERKREYWLPLFVPLTERSSAKVDGASEAFTPEALGRRVASLALRASGGDVVEAGRRLNCLPRFACQWARSQMEEALADEYDEVTPDKQKIARDMKSWAASRLPMSTARINDAQALQLCRVFIWYRDGSGIAAPLRRMMKLLFRVAQLHGHSPRQLGSFQSDNKFRGFGKKLRVFSSKGEGAGTQALTASSVARLRWREDGEEWVGVDRNRGVRGSGQKRKRAGVDEVALGAVQKPAA